MKTSRELHETIPISFTASSNAFRNMELHMGTDKILISWRWLMRRGVDEDKWHLEQQRQCWRNAMFSCSQTDFADF